MERYKDGVRQYNKEDKSHVRDLWLEKIRHSHMSYVEENKKKRLYRKRKYKNDSE